MAAGLAAWLTSQSGIAAIVSAALTAAGLMTRFSQRRLMSSAASIILFALIVIISGAVASAAALIPAGGKVGLLGIGTAIPFWTRRPGTGGDLRTNAGPGRAVFTQITTVVWAITGFLTDALDNRLSHHKGMRVIALKAELNARYADTTLVLAERMQVALKAYLEGLTDEPKVKLRTARLRKAYDDSRTNDWDIDPFVSLAYDWRIDKVLPDLVTP